MFLIPLLSAWLIVSFGWRSAYATLAVLVAVVVFAFSRLLKRDPTETGDHAYGADESAPGQYDVPAVDLTFRETLRTAQFWTLSASYFLVWYATQSAMVHIAPHGVDTGLSVGQAAAVVSEIGGVSILGRLTIGVAGDRVGARRAVIICFGFLLAALTWLQFSNEAWMLYIFAPLYGFAHGGFFAILSPLVADLFGIRSHASNLGMLFFVGMTGGAAGPIVTGILYDATGTYRPAFLVMLIAGIVGMFLALALRPVAFKRRTARIVGTTN
jgi:MFS family permease